MAYQYLIVPDTEEIPSESWNPRVAVNLTQVEKLVREQTNRFPNAAICVYRLDTLKKIKTPATYSTYKSLESGEIIPV